VSKVSFAHAFERWYNLTHQEHGRIEGEKKKGSPIHSFEALDHMCGLAVESGLKALMIKAKLVKSDPQGDFPGDPTTKRRPHVDELWDAFMAKATNRTAADWIKRLSGGAREPPNVFQEWRADHRYATDGTVREAVVALRVKLAKELKKIAQEEGL
jgi:hypothetical protein